MSGTCPGCGEGLVLHYRSAQELLPQNLVGVKTDGNEWKVRRHRSCRICEVLLQG